MLLRVKDGKLDTMPDRERVSFKLSNNTTMSIQICAQDKATLIKEDYDDIMQAVIAGWEHEITVLNGWSEEQQQRYRDRFYNLKIIERVK